MHRTLYGRGRGRVKVSVSFRQERQGPPSPQGAETSKSAASESDGDGGGSVIGAFSHPASHLRQPGLRVRGREQSSYMFWMHQKTKAFPLTVWGRGGGAGLCNHGDGEGLGWIMYGEWKKKEQYACGGVDTAK